MIILGKSIPKYVSEENFRGSRICRQGLSENHACGGHIDLPHPD